MEKKLFLNMVDLICGSFPVGCEGCPLKDLWKKKECSSCEHFLDHYQNDAEIVLATWIGGAGYVKGSAKQETKKTPETRREILQAAERCVCGGRELDHGTPEHSFHAIARQWEAYLASRRLLKEGATVNAWDAATMLALFKVARISAGNFVADSYVDGCGYLACAGELAANEQEENHEE